MSASDRLKRQLFQGLADDNIEVIRNQPRGTLRRNRARKVQLIRRAMVAGSGMLVVAITVIAGLAIRSDASSGNHQFVGAGRSPGDGSVVAPVRDGGDSVLSNLAEVITGRQTQAIDPYVIPLAVQTVVLDPGHGGIDSGTLTPFGMLEKDLTWDIARRLGRMLENSRVHVVLTRPGDENISLKERTEIANRAQADLFVSIHVNWLPDREARGFETYFAGSTADPFLKSLAAMENNDSGFSVADTRRLLDGLYAGVRTQESQRLAECVGRSLYGTLRNDNPEVVDRGVMRAPFVVLVATEMPAVLAEVACLSNNREATLIAQPQYRQRIAEALFTGIQGYARAVSASERGGNT